MKASVESVRKSHEAISSSARSRISRRGVLTSSEDVDSRGGYISKILYVKTKESGPLVGRALGTPPRSANV